MPAFEDLFPLNGRWEIHGHLPDHWIAARITDLPGACIPIIGSQHLLDWLNHIVVPEVLRGNEARVFHAIPEQPQFDVEALTRAS